MEDKISASLVLGSYLDTLGFNNSLWEFNYNAKLSDIGDCAIVNNEIIYHYIMAGGKNIDLSSWIASDDTIMMIATMKACKRGGSEKHFIDEYLKILPLLEQEKRVSGITTLESLNILKKTHDPKKIHYSNKMGGNGAAMRTHYIGIHFKDDIDKIIATSIMASRLTHNYPIGFLGGMVTALFTNYALNNIEPWKWVDMLLELNENGTIDKYMETTDIYDKYLKDKDEFWTPWYKFKEFRVDKFYYRSGDFTYFQQRIENLLKLFYDDFKKIDYNRMGGSGVEATIIALDSILCCITPIDNIMKDRKFVKINIKDNKSYKYNWDQLVLLSTLQFWDNDTIGAITGMWYGALRGYDGISKDVINMLEYKKELII